MALRDFWLYYVKVIYLDEERSENAEEDVYYEEYLRAIETAMMAYPRFVGNNPIRTNFKNDMTPVFTRHREIALAFNSEEEAYTMAHFIRWDMESREEKFEDIEVEEEKRPGFENCSGCKQKCLYTSTEGCWLCEREGRRIETK